MTTLFNKLKVCLVPILIFFFPSQILGQNETVNAQVDSFVLKVSTGDFSTIDQDYKKLLNLSLTRDAQGKVELAMLDRYAVLGNAQKHITHFQKLILDGLAKELFTEHSDEVRLQMGYYAVFTNEYESAWKLFSVLVSDEEVEVKTQCRALSELVTLSVSAKQKKIDFIPKILSAMGGLCTVELFYLGIELHEYFPNFIINTLEKPLETETLFELIEGVLNDDELQPNQRIALTFNASAFYFTNTQYHTALAYALETLENINSYAHDGSIAEIQTYLLISLCLQELVEEQKSIKYAEVAFSKIDDLSRFASSDQLEILIILPMFFERLSIADSQRNYLLERLEKILSSTANADHLQHSRLLGYSQLMQFGALEKFYGFKKNTEELYETIEVQSDNNYIIASWLGDNTTNREKKLKYYREALSLAENSSEMKPINKAVWTSLASYSLALEYRLGNNTEEELKQAKLYARMSAEYFLKAIEGDLGNQLLKRIDVLPTSLLSFWYECIVAYAPRSKEGINDEALSELFMALKAARTNSDRRAYLHHPSRLYKNDLAKFSDGWVDDIKQFIKRINQKEYSLVLAQNELVRNIGNPYPSKIDIAFFIANYKSEYLFFQRSSRMETSEGITLNEYLKNFRKAFDTYADNFGETSYLLPENTAYLVVHRNRKGYDFTLIGTGLIIPLFSIDYEEIDPYLNRLWKSVNNPSQVSKLSNFDFAASHKIYELIIGSIDFTRYFGSSVDRLIFFGDGKLGNFPLEILVSQLPTSDEIANNDIKWLDDKYEISFGIDIAEIIRPENLLLNTFEIVTNFDENFYTKQFLGVGNPKLAQFGTKKRAVSFVESEQKKTSLTDFLKQLPSLPNAKEELTNLKSKFKSSKSMLLSGEKASEDSLKKIDLKNFDILMFSTHTIFKNEHPSVPEPALVLSPDNSTEHDHILTAREIMELDLNAEIVLLNSCNTAVVEDFNNTSLASLGTAFLIAGARSIMISHWPISDDSTKFLTEKMFGSIEEGDAKSYGHALSIAKKKTRSDPNFAHPFHWAAFKVYEPYIYNIESD